MEGVTAPVLSPGGGVIGLSWACSWARKPEAEWAGPLTSHDPPRMQGSSPSWHLPLLIGGVGWPSATQWFHWHGQPLTSLVAGERSRERPGSQAVLSVALGSAITIGLLGMP